MPLARSRSRLRPVRPPRGVDRGGCRLAQHQRLRCSIERDPGVESADLVRAAVERRLSDAEQMLDAIDATSGQQCAGEDEAE